MTMIANVLSLLSKNEKAFLSSVKYIDYLFGNEHERVVVASAADAQKDIESLVDKSPTIVQNNMGDFVAIVEKEFLYADETGRGNTTK